ncbi:MAG TPA: methyltransferase [Vicinamibacterales bacterium]|nr:methyltransferase [Vicinamibacterales bacterium]
MSTVDSSAASSAPPDAAAARLLFQAATGYVVSAALHVAVSLQIVEQLSGGPKAVRDLAAGAGVPEDGLYRVLRALTTAGIFAEVAPKTFAVTPAALLLRKGAGALGDGVEFFCDPLHLRAYGEMLYSVRTGQSAGAKVVGMPLFEYLARNPEYSAIFNDAMTSFSANVMPAVLQAYDFSGIGVLVDVAGGHGHVLTSVLQKYPSMRGVLFDIAHVIAGAQPLIDAAGVADRVRTESGDFFREVPAGGDAYIMKHIIHDWDDDRSLTILRNIHTRLEGRPGGRLILLEAVVPADNTPHLSKLLDIEMMLMPGGRERTEQEFAALLEAAGFALTRIVPNESMLSVIEGRPR